jgi:folate-dependent phosphoribosylglycinamide formyltransferase PurN
VEICFATASDPCAPVVSLCGELGIPCHILKPRPRSSFETRLIELCQECRPHLIALAGFMSLLSADLIEALGVPILNIHPALLPNYGGKGMYGSRVHDAVFASGDKVSGASVHIVDGVYDHGRVIAREEVDISDCASPDAIAVKVLRAEHRLYAPAIYKYLTEQ